MAAMQETRERLILPSLPRPQERGDGTSSIGRAYYDMAPGGYCDYVNTHYDVYVGGDGC